VKRWGRRLGAEMPMRFWRAGRLAVDRKSGPHSQCPKSKLAIYLTFLVEEIRIFESLKRFDEAEFKCTANRGNIARRGMRCRNLTWDLGKSGPRFYPPRCRVRSSFLPRFFCAW
jgi:hypothetical protein